MRNVVALLVFLCGVEAAFSDELEILQTAPAVQSPQPLTLAVTRTASVPSTTKMPPQVLLHLSVYELSLTKMQRFGLELEQVAGGKKKCPDVRRSSNVAGKAAGKEEGPHIPPTGRGTFCLQDLDDSDGLLRTIKAMRQDRIIKVLAEPTLVTVSGRAATFHVGGEIPVLIPQGSGTVSVEYKKYGTMIDFLPTILDDATVHLEIRAEISELDRQNGMTVAGNVVPAIRSCKMDTAMNLKAGRTVVLSGLQQHTAAKPNAAENEKKTSESKANPTEKKPAVEETVLLFVLKPEIVEPLEVSAK
ncbi:MAG: hypothetical protein JXB10_02950 [Pirellulales bacterium]|nr:hypothetical protein [Pirellulales bacterium]